MRLHESNFSLGIRDHRTSRRLDDISEFGRCHKIPGFFLDKKACLLLLMRHCTSYLIHSLAPLLENHFFSVLTVGTLIQIKNEEVRKDMVHVGEQIQK